MIPLGLNHHNRQHSHSGHVNISLIVEDELCIYMFYYDIHIGLALYDDLWLHYNAMCDRCGEGEWWPCNRVSDFQSRGRWFNPTCRCFET